MEMVILKSVDELLEHIKDVQKSAIDLSKESTLNMSAFIEKNSLEIDDDVATAMQYQDIISQQLSATIEAIQSVQNSLDRFTHSYKADESLAVENISKLQQKVQKALVEAKDKKERFSGKSSQTDDEFEEIEFF
jgi:predicted RNA-binding protein with EMAP domain